MHIQARLPLSYPGNLTSRFRPNHANGKKSINISLKNRRIKPLDLAGSKKNPNFALRKGATAHAQGVVLEWLKRHAWKACIRQKRIPSSNLGEWLKRHAWKACIRQKRIPSSNLGHSAMNTLEAINPHSRPPTCSFLCNHIDDEVTFPYICINNTELKIAFEILYFKRLRCNRA